MLRRIVAAAESACAVNRLALRWLGGSFTKFSLESNMSALIDVSSGNPVITMLASLGVACGLTPPTARGEAGGFSSDEFAQVDRGVPQPVGALPDTQWTHRAVCARGR